ncbi:DDHD [Penicillium digitatum]|uniref:DDHD domain-containing protein n=3 Tax=Penicillium digitatum TaxID=36651 RepID=K9FY06_PEND2|nr:hypothetical protein PDIP_81380 [Penicillium digitatum Pd1]EKV05782.1 hypothetical protein PDIP_81380 [Penicillium digitatum Pd1]EKV07598.1 hypothetical protein PDIG_72110 [Penicillium digitatum PHI26]QQK40479.1 DDHD [Penicillium digitatum]
MAGLIHTYGPSCLLVDEEQDLTRFQSLQSPPEFRAQFFYMSSLPIDDPLAPLPPPASQGTGNERHSPTPFSARDNIALEEAWRDLREARKTKVPGNYRSRPNTSTGPPEIEVPGHESVSNVERRKAANQEDPSLVDSRGSTLSNPVSFPDDLPYRSYKRHLTCATSGAAIRTRELGKENRLDSPLGDGSIYNTTREIAIDRKRVRSSSINESSVTKRRGSSQLEAENVGEGDEGIGSLRADRSHDASMSGSPFIRAPASQPQTPLGRSLESSSSREGGEGQAELRTGAAFQGAPKLSGLRMTVSLDKVTQELQRERIEEPNTQSKIPVGVSRLHLVELPSLKMKPIYWSPLQDISSVVRATWFYKNTMLPVETELANKLEEGYVYLKPWSDTWQDELNSCVENGADAELKIVHPLWTKQDSRPTAAKAPHSRDSPVDEAEDPFVFAENRAAGGTSVQSESIKTYYTSSAIYVDATNAQVLRPSLLPSVSRGRRPLSAIRKGRQIGIPVIRGFSRKRWEQLHPSKPNPIDVRHYIRKAQSNVPSARGEQICYACKMEESRPRPTDLVLVIHGIGQKLSERMESFHFTHAINAFRREVNMELNNEPVWPHVRQDHGGIMVLPVNWRTNLSLDDPELETGIEDPATNKFSLTDITPQTLPAIRSLISDVMLDIPYYLSHHKPKMVKAVIREANRVYRLWCKNNQGFQDHGRVHLIAHSLGSVMAVDILSNQPTHVPRFDFSNTALQSDVFEFDTRHLFLCGSPVGFFLLLNKASLVPRKGKDKPGSNGDDLLHGVAGEAGQYGCLAVDNLYNIMHTTDPIAYRVNATVDSDLSNSLKMGSIPSSTSTFWQSIGSVFRWSTTPSTSLSSTAPTRPAAVSKLPSNVELEIHDFTREEIAEKRMLLLNDNGQVDYYLSGGGGPLNIQYLNMLSAHSSYWTLGDFVRFLVVEIARKPGREGTLPAFRSEKKKGWKNLKG